MLDDSSKLLYLLYLSVRLPVVGWLHSLLTSSLLSLLRLLQSINCGPFHLIHLIANNRRIAMTSTVLDVKELIDSCCAPVRSSQTSQGIVFVKCQFQFISIVSTDFRYNFLPALNMCADLNELTPQVEVEWSYAIIFLLSIDVKELCVYKNYLWNILDNHNLVSFIFQDTLVTLSDNYGLLLRVFVASSSALLICNRWRCMIPIRLPF